MMVLVSYDVATSDPGGPRRLRRVAKVCTNHGQRVQYSVFECIVDPGQWVKMKEQLVDAIGRSVVKELADKIEHIGAKEGIDQEGPLIL